MQECNGKISTTDMIEQNKGSVSLETAYLKNIVTGEKRAIYFEIHVKENIKRFNLSDIWSSRVTWKWERNRNPNQGIEIGKVSAPGERYK